eukprot:scaffold2041_cov20-Tisochrysis_lutea.AAC.1
MAIAQSHSSVLVLDYGSQYTQLITRRIREAGIFSVLFPGDASFVGDEASSGPFSMRGLQCVFVACYCVAVALTYLIELRGLSGTNIVLAH